MYLASEYASARMVQSAEIIPHFVPFVKYIAMISDTWAITAAHCFAEGPTKLDGKTVAIHGVDFQVDKVFLHPCGLEVSQLLGV